MSSDLQSLVDTISEQEESLRFPYFSADVAWEVGSAVRERFMNARSQGRFEKQGCVIQISTFTGQTLFAAAVGDESAIGPVNWKWVEGKKDVARNWNHSSFYVGQHALLKGWEREQYAFGGGFPIWIKGCPSAPLAIIVVSGLAEEDDHQLIVDTLSDYIPRMKPVAWRSVTKRSHAHFLGSLQATGDFESVQAPLTNQGLQDTAFREIVTLR